MGWWEYLQQQMTRRRMSQADVAKAMGIPSSTVSRWRVQAPSPENLRRLAHVLEVPVLQLFVHAGYLTQHEAGIKEVEARDQEPPVDIFNVIDAMDALQPRAKDHLKNQVNLLLELQQETPPPDVTFAVPRRRKTGRRSEDPRDRTG